MKETSERLAKLMAEATLKTVKDEIRSLGDLKNVSSVNIDLLHTYVDLVEAVAEYELKVAETLIAIDEKLDELLKRQEEIH